MAIFIHTLANELAFVLDYIVLACIVYKSSADAVTAWRATTTKNCTQKGLN